MICGMILIYGVALLRERIGLNAAVKQILWFSFLISALINSTMMSDKLAWYPGWYLSWPVIEYVFPLFGSNIIANIILIVLLLSWIVWAWNTAWVQLPTVTISQPENITSKQQQAAKNQQNVNVWGLMNSVASWLKSVADRMTQSSSEPAKSPASMNHTIQQQPAMDRSEQHDSHAWVWWDLKSAIKDKLMNKLWHQVAAVSQVTYTAPVYPKSKPVFSIWLLEKPNPELRTDDVKIAMQAEMIRAKLAEFDIPVTIDGWNVGPSIVQIKIRPDTWVKISAVENHKPDIMAALKTRSLRIIAPIPGTDVVGLEIPNPQPVVVRLSEVMWSNEFADRMKKSLLQLSIGKTVDGWLLVRSLEEMPHLLVAWATGQWKSVWINDFILSLMYQNSPDEIKFIMVDPKQVEMELYSGLPYQLCPIITDPEVALKALKWCAVEMDERYTILKNHRVRNLKEYAEKTGENLPRIVVVIDELADLMMTGKKKDVEIVIARIAQKARAVGMHLILATQRPSVNVITGLIKANIPTRISFGVVSQIDSRTILDMKGAEDLMGRWDLLYMDPSTKFPVRVQAPLVDTPEIERIAQAIKDKYLNGVEEDQIYHPWLMKILESKAWMWIGWFGWDFADESDDDQLCNAALELISDSRRASTTFLQKKLSIGFARASRIMDMLEERWVVGPQEWSKPREVLI
jgi:DNA segregation ATPase FtsK/SpoIIIE-like protein